MARLHTGRDKVLSTYRSYHGNTGAAIVATGDWRRMPNQYARGHAHFFGPFLYRSEFWATTPEEESERALHHLERVIQSEGAEHDRRDPARVDPGHRRHPRSAARLPRGRARAVRPVRHHADPRRGHVRASAAPGAGSRSRATTSCPTSSPSRRASTPATCRSAASSSPRRSRRPSTTASSPAGSPTRGHPLAAASIVASIDAMEEEGIVENARRIGADAIGPGLAALAEQHPLIGEVRGEGVFWALDLVDRPRDARAGAGRRHRRSSRRSSSTRGLLPFAPTTASTWCRRASSPTTRSPQALAIYDEAFTAVEA